MPPFAPEMGIFATNGPYGRTSRVQMGYLCGR